ncbi:MAG: ABC transporter permease subunit [Actinobacteria bacterium]|nr:ABC transporter permease subunit [Actinomycetota bacterium]
MTTVRGLLSRRWVLVLIVVITWVILAAALKGVSTLELSTAADTPFTAWLRDLAASIRGNRTKSPAFLYFFNPIRLGVQGFIEPIRSVIAVPAEGDLIPLFGWLGVVALIGYIVYATSNLRTSVLSMALVFGCGVLGVWADSMDTLALTLGAVFLSLLIGFPLGVWAGLNDRVMAVIRPVLDLAQILPTLVYLAPLALVFLIGIASATIATLIYSIPICIRITAHAVRSLKAGPVEAAQSMGSTRWQLLTKVQLPMARQTLILGVNQTTLAALSFVVIAALIGAPGLGKPVIDALTIRNVGDGLTAGLAVVLLAVMLDRATTAAVLRSQSYVPVAGPALIRRRIGLIGGGIATVVAIVLSRNQLWAAVFPPQLNFGEEISAFFDTIVSWVTSTFDFLTTGLNTAFTTIMLNPLEGLLANSPWYLTITAISLVALIVGGRNVAVLSVFLMLAVVAIGLWHDTMITLSQVLLATAVVMVVGVVLGVIAGRSERAERFLKPVLDAGQTLPAFVYLVPVLALFGPTRFAAIVCGVFYAAPVVVRVVADGVKGVPSDMVEAAVASGSTTTQVITKVQLPASKKSLLLGANQGLIFVLAVIVIGGLVGAGGLGYLVLVGQSKPELTGKGLAAGLAIVLLGIMLDRIAHASAQRSDRSSS